MINWLKRNWFITLRTEKEMRHISFINIIEMSISVEGEKHFLSLVTSVGTYKCEIPATQCRRYAGMFCECDLNFYNLRDILCNSIEFIKSN